MSELGNNENAFDEEAQMFAEKKLFNNENINHDSDSNKREISDCEKFEVSENKNNDSFPKDLSKIENPNNVNETMNSKNKNMAILNQNITILNEEINENNHLNDYKEDKDFNNNENKNKPNNIINNVNNELNKNENIKNDDYLEIRNEEVIKPDLNIPLNNYSIDDSKEKEEKRKNKKNDPFKHQDTSKEKNKINENKIEEKYKDKPLNDNENIDNRKIDNINIDNKDICINIENLVSYDKKHNIKKNELSNEVITQNKNNLLNDITIYSELNFEKLNNVQNFILENSLDEEILTDQIKTLFEDSLNNNVIIRQKIIELSINYKNSINNQNNYIKKYINNISPCYQFPKMKSLWEDIFCYRRVKSDGDSFYKSFMFSLIEKYIVYKNYLQFKLLIWDFYSKLKEAKTFFYRDVQIDINETIIIFEILFNYLNENKINDCIEMLNLCFCEKNNFCNSLVKYMKIKLGCFIKDNYKLFNKDEYKGIIQDKYYGEEHLNYSLYLQEKVYLMQYEPDLFIYYITPLAFQMNFKLILNEQFSENIKVYHNFPLESEDYIDLIYDDKNYLIGYNNKYYNLLNYDIQDDDIINVYKKIKSGSDDGYVENRKVNEIDKSITIYKEKIFCSKCKDKYDEIILNKIYPDFLICQNCLKYCINKVLINRINNLENEGYENIEYYTRNIELSDDEKNKEKLYLSPSEFKFIYGEEETIYSQIINLIKNPCTSCLKVFDIDSVIKMECNCKLCNECINQLIEKNSTKCICGNNFNLKYVKKQLNDLNGNDNNSVNLYATKNPDDYNDICMICNNKIVVNNKKNSNKNYYEPLEITFKEHKICLTCLKKLINQKNEKEYILEKCKICDTVHNIRYRHMKKFFRETNKCKCSIF